MYTTNNRDELDKFTVTDRSALEHLLDTAIAAGVITAPARFPQASIGTHTAAGDSDVTITVHLSPSRPVQQPLTRRQWAFLTPTRAVTARGLRSKWVIRQILVAATEILAEQT